MIIMGVYVTRVPSVTGVPSIFVAADYSRDLYSACIACVLNLTELTFCFPNTEPVRPLSMFQAGLDGGFRASKYEWKQSTNTNL
ncbi:hypothetical protein I350_05145 [Cryptococcus amylolentus CBS 6273]|nr:hypothetical protein I350_05145 [Cryptococcus amylolentus CBS 6273]